MTTFRSMTPRLGGLFLALAAWTLPIKHAGAVTTAPLPCSAAYQINQTFSNGAKWEMCWEPRAGYAYRLSDIIFTPPNGLRRKVLGSLHLAQLFVPYDDNGARYHDIGFGMNLARLTAAECPGGALQTNSALCLTRRSAGFSMKDVVGGTSRQDEHFVLFGYYGLGAYYYVFQYAFHNDGTIAPSLGASGSLQRYGGNDLTGWPVKNRIAVNHSHLAMWRMDFDVDGIENNAVEQVDFRDDGTGQRVMSITALPVETKVRNDLAGGRFWRVVNTAVNNPNGNRISYEIEPSVSDQMRASEDFTRNDLYLTQYRNTETTVDAGLDSFVNNEPLTDPVLWYGVNFHHVPRGEDDVEMPIHWQGFRIVPRDLTSTSTGNQRPVINNPGAQSTAVATAVNLAIVAVDPEGSPLRFSATGLPAGLSLDTATGRITGTPTTIGSNTVTVTASDDLGASATLSFAWQVVAAQGTTRSFSNPAAVTIRDRNSANPYPLQINVTGTTGNIAKVTVKLSGLSHTYPADIDIVLVSPTGQKVILLSDAGGGSDVSGIDLTLDDDATVATTGVSRLGTGLYRPANLDAGTDVFPTPAPTGPFATTLATFRGQAANGMWTLFVRDDASVDTGTLSGGAELTITTE